MSGDPSGPQRNTAIQEKSNGSHEREFDDYEGDADDLEEAEGDQRHSEELEELWDSEDHHEKRVSGESEPHSGEQLRAPTGVALPLGPSPQRSLVSSPVGQGAAVSLNDSVMSSTSQLALIFKDLIQRATGITTLGENATQKLSGVRDLIIRTEEAKVFSLCL